MSTFTADEAARRWRCSLETVEQFLSDFTAAGFVTEHTSPPSTARFGRKDTDAESDLPDQSERSERAIGEVIDGISVKSTWSVTPKGLALALVLARVDDREPVA